MQFTTNESTVTKGECTATCLARTVSPEGGIEIVTWELKYPRYIHAELMTHRCLTADTVLTFDLPSGTKGSECRQYQMTLGEFWDKWENGSAPHATRWGGVRRYDMKGRLNKMRLRSVDESTMEVVHTTITDCWKVGVKPVYKLTAGDFSVTCTADHLILTDKGWKELQDIAPGRDSVLCNTRKKYAEPRIDPYKKIGGKWVSRWTKEVMPEVAARQEFRCADCGAEDKPLEIHHVVPKYENPDLAFDINNVVALCEECHKNRHRVQGWQGTSQCNVLGVEVDAIEYVGEEEVFDISVSSDYHNFLANGITVHNCFSRNASSSRATPLKVTLDEVRNNPAGFSKVGVNQPGMVAGNELLKEERDAFLAEWRILGAEVAKSVEALSECYGVHKQILNRALEPWLYMHTIVTTTDVDNFFKLRLARDAQPEMQDLAQAMLFSMFNKQKKEDTWHFPYRDLIKAAEADENITRNVAACARVCVMKHDGSESTLEQDKALYDKLLAGGHLTPFEHVATSEVPGYKYANFNGWCSVRWKIENGFEVDG